jgi:hypothetical protein
MKKTRTMREYWVEVSSKSRSRPPVFAFLLKELARVTKVVLEVSTYPIFARSRKPRR